MEDVLAKIREASPEAARAWEAFLAAQRVYVGALRAMGLAPQPQQEVASTADVRVSVTPADRVA